MIGFYLTIDTKKHAHINLSSSWAGISPLGLLRQPGLHVFDDPHRQMIRSTRHTLFNIGSLIYRNHWREEALQSIITDLDEGRTLREIMSDTRGQFCLIVHSGRDVYVMTDKLGSLPVYAFESDGIIQISNIFLFLAKNNSISVNHQAFAEYLSFDCCLGSTFFNEIRCLERSTINQFGTQRRTETYYDVFSDIHFNTHTKLPEVVDAVEETLTHNLSFLNSKDEIYVDLTGGFDTRTVATLLRRMNISFQAGICGEQVLNETELGRKVAQQLGANYETNTKITDPDLFKTALDYHFMINTGIPILYHATELVNYYEHIRHRFAVHLTGFAGTQLLARPLPKLRLTSSRIDKKSLLRKWFDYKDIFTNSFLTKCSYNDHVLETIDQLLQTIGSDLHDDVANIIPFAMYNRHFHGLLIGTHNAIMPLYSPFFESNLVRLMIETSPRLKKNHAIQRKLITSLNSSVSSIMTTHGYSANFTPPGANVLLRRSWNFIRSLVRQVIYESAFLVDIMQCIQSMKARIVPQRVIAEVQRSFWVNEVNKAWSEDMEILEVIDPNRLKTCLAREKRPTHFKAKIIYLNRLINECNARL